MTLLHCLCLCHTQIYLRFLEYQLENSNECKKNFVAIYEGSNAIEDLKAKFCSTIANDITLDNAVGVVRMWADETSKLSRFRMLFTVFAERKRSSHFYILQFYSSLFIYSLTNGFEKKSHI